MTTTFCLHSTVFIERQGQSNSRTLFNFQRGTWANILFYVIVEIFEIFFRICKNIRLFIICYITFVASKKQFYTITLAFKLVLLTFFLKINFYTHDLQHKKRKARPIKFLKLKKKLTWGSLSRGKSLSTSGLGNQPEKQGKSPGFRLVWCKSKFHISENVVVKSVSLNIF